MIRWILSKLGYKTMGRYVYIRGKWTPISKIITSLVWEIISFILFNVWIILVLYLILS